MAIVRVDPADPTSTSLVQVDSTAGNLWLAIDEIDDWAAAHGFVRTSEYHLRRVLVNDGLRYRGICFRPSAEELSASEQAHRGMIDRAEQLPERVGDGREER